MYFLVVYFFSKLLILYYNYNIIDENDNVVVNGQQLKEEGKIFWELEEPINNYIAKEDCLINGELLVTAHFNSQQGRILSIHCFYKKDIN